MPIQHDICFVEKIDDFANYAHLFFFLHVYVYVCV